MTSPCPKCGAKLSLSNYGGEVDGEHVWCDVCGWRPQTLAERLHAASYRQNLDDTLRALLTEAAQSIPPPPARMGAQAICQRMADAGMRRVQDGQIIAAIVVDGDDKALLSNLEPMDQIPELMRSIAQAYETAISVELPRATAQEGAKEERGAAWQQEPGPFVVVNCGKIVETRDTCSDALAARKEFIAAARPLGIEISVYVTTLARFQRNTIATDEASTERAPFVPRYLIVNLDKRQTDLVLVGELCAGWQRDCDEYLTMVVDIAERRRYVGGEWQSIRVKDIGG